MSKKYEVPEYYIPKDLDDCFVELKRLLKRKEVKEIKDMEEDDVSMLHHQLGRYLRNRWGLWGESCLSKWFNDKKIKHPDDMSSIVLTSFWRHLNSKPIELDEQIKHSRDYWKEVLSHREKY